MLILQVLVPCSERVNFISMHIGCSQSSVEDLQPCSIGILLLGLGQELCNLMSFVILFHWVLPIGSEPHQFNRGFIILFSGTSYRESHLLVGMCQLGPCGRSLVGALQHHQSMVPTMIRVSFERRERNQAMVNPWIFR